MLPVGQAVRRRALIVRPSDTVERVAKAFSRHKVGSAVVVEDGEVVGVITDRDILDKVVAKGRDPKTVRVHEVMTRNPVTIEEDYDISDAIDKMMEKGVRRLLVTRLGKPLGFVTAADLLAALNSINPDEEPEGDMEFYGICELCGQYGPLYRVNVGGQERWVCESCRDTIL